jgi:dynein heavy chain
MILAPVEALLEQVADDQLSLQKVQASKYNRTFETEVAAELQRLGKLEAVLSLWWEVQSLWASLVNLFSGSSDIHTQLPEDAQRFAAVDADWRRVMEGAQKTAGVVDACSVAGLSDKLKDILRVLEGCHASLQGYLEVKRRIFPRFYFVSSTDLIDILSRANDPMDVCNLYMRKLFDNVASVDFDTSLGKARTALALRSAGRNGERVELSSPHSCNGQAENWLTGLTKAARETMVALTAEALVASADTSRSREDWIHDLPAQVAILASQVVWTSAVELAFKRYESGNDSALRNQLFAQQEQIEVLTEMVAKDLTEDERVKVSSLIILDVHARDVVAQLVDDHVERASSFAWQRQLRFAWEDDERSCTVMMADARFPYSFEYVGNSRRLVITPLTDRCYMTIMQALALRMGASPSGPAGTGKTETTKDLGHSLGLPVFVFNCNSYFFLKKKHEYT